MKDRGHEECVQLLLLLRLRLRLRLDPVLTDIEESDAEEAERDRRREPRSPRGGGEGERLSLPPPSRTPRMGDREGDLEGERRLRRMWGGGDLERSRVPFSSSLVRRG